MKNARILGIVGLIFLLSCGLTEVEPSSTINGKVSIGPLCGIVPEESSGIQKSGNPCGLSDAQMDSVYSKYSVVLKNSNNLLIAEQILNKNGKFSFLVEEGSYKLSVESSKVNFSTFNQESNIKKEVKITKNSISSFEFFINTGIQ
jgi:hypothetical protein